MMPGISAGYRLVVLGRARCVTKVCNWYTYPTMPRLTLSTGGTYYQANGQWACCSTDMAGCSNLAIGCANGNMIYRATQTGSSSLTNSLITRAWYVSKRMQISAARPYLIFSTAHRSGLHQRIGLSVFATRPSYSRTSVILVQKSTLFVVFHL
jgi:hypothetical protein